MSKPQKQLVVRRTWADTLSEGFWMFIHNAVAHPLMAFTFNSRASIQFHQWTALKMYTPFDTEWSQIEEEIEDLQHEIRKLEKKVSQTPTKRKIYRRCCTVFLLDAHKKLRQASVWANRLDGGNR